MQQVRPTQRCAAAGLPGADKAEQPTAELSFISSTDGTRVSFPVRYLKDEPSYANLSSSPVVRWRRDLPPRQGQRKMVLLQISVRSRCPPQLWPPLRLHMETRTCSILMRVSPLPGRPNGRELEGFLGLISLGVIGRQGQTSGRNMVGFPRPRRGLRRPRPRRTHRVTVTHGRQLSSATWRQPTPSNIGRPVLVAHNTGHRNSSRCPPHGFAPEAVATPIVHPRGGNTARV
jgi:hypothetical protein